MIGHVSIGSSFYHCISYCLEDKKELSEQQKKELSVQDHLQHRERAEVLEYNKCFGNKHELTQQFKDVQKLSKRVEKPVLHLSLRLAPGETLTKDQLIEMGRACAVAFGVAENQYICVLHKDTKEQHIHIAANRVGLNGKVASDSNSYKRMASLCRSLEKQYNLQAVLSPRAFLSQKDRLLPRQDQRKERLKADIRQTLEKVSYYSAFEKQMQTLGYKVIKGRGISFIDDKKVKIKGSEVGFSMAKIDRILGIRQQLEMNKAKKHRQPGGNRSSIAYAKAPAQDYKWEIQESFEMIEKQLSSILYQLLKPEEGVDYINPELIKEARKKGRRRRVQISN
ncbi:relaxase/mobilization nuclease domain-containing protein [Emticicia sp. 21SJ11W-3]|uniref:relaxase/mobilization nuclease domain-containing protein n=1 Tax=Emticicia sp. 21SJ11W-3 TaxID=2916755 RepID=UPI0020A11ECC|nr:relaxase/mobilization nuclease domain-containing protein [Emticicia sp. 21SJ11W-3]UTA67565.1 relaxase/mobilization nuclease domain-containing protein [Emticicia sp. 21SJ11W-3]